MSQAVLLRTMPSLALLALGRLLLRLARAN
jgi:hypothetical protein